MRKLLLISVVLIFTLTIFIGTVSAAPNFTMSWSFQLFNNPNARQVAMNRAEKQDGLIEEEEDPIKRFADGLERRLYSSAQREIVDMIMDDEEVPYGEFEAGNLQISVAEDPLTNEVIVEITDIITGDSTVITYSADEYGSDFGW